jgi:hypothetical protein
VSQAARALGGLEGRRLIRHPLFLTGIAFVLIGTAYFVRSSLVETTVGWEDDGWTVGAGFTLLGLLAMIATNLAALRDRRAGAVEQHETLPVTRASRTGGLLLGVGWPVAACTLLLAPIWLYAASKTELSSLDLLHAVDLMALIGMLGVLGVTIARWLPNPFLAPVAAWGLILTSPAEANSRWHALSPFASADSVDLAAWHLVYVLGLAVCFAGAALMRDRAPRALVAVIAGLGVAGLAVGVMLATACPGLGRCQI